MGHANTLIYYPKHDRNSITMHKFFPKSPFWLFLDTLNHPIFTILNLIHALSSCLSKEYCQLTGYNKHWFSGNGAKGQLCRAGQPESERESVDRGY
ncbi:hypothetical protein B738_16748 [Photorhabdus temperata subsp. temperata M1021]|nr:hypothetical protein B738_16748 [Photorhabdus temperata subsp. temperata M1021]